CDVNARNPVGESALFWAASKGNSDCVKVLVTASADVKTKNVEGWTALMEAASKGNAESVKILIAAGADVKAKDRNHETALTKAVYVARQTTKRIDKPYMPNFGKPTTLGGLFANILFSGIVHYIEGQINPNSTT